MPIYQIKVPFPERYLSKVTKAILDWAEGLPKFKGGYIHSLQKERIRQREHSQRTFEQTRPPKGTELELLSIRMIELFQYEEFQTLRASLECMFPSLEGFQLGQPFRRYFDELGDSLDTGGWINIGWIYREKKPLVLLHCLHLPNLPVEVDYIEVYLHKILPSTIVISMDIRLNNSATVQLKKLHSSKYLSELRIQSIYPQEKMFGISQWTPDKSMEQIITGMLVEIRKDVENSIRPYICGDFMNQSTENAKLPAIEIYGLKGLRKERNNFVLWANKARGWWKSLGFKLYFQTFNNKKLAFHWAHKAIYTDALIPSRVLLFWESYLKDLNIKMYGGDEKLAITSTICDFLNTILIPFSAIEFLNQKVEGVKRFRSTLYSNMTKGKFGNQDLRKQLIVYGELQHEIRKTERFLLEFDQAKKIVEREFRESNLGKMLYTNLQPDHKQHIENFEENVFARINYLRKTFDEHMSFLNKSFTTHVEYLNVNAIYRLQITALILSLIALIATVFGVLGNWKDIVDLIKHIIAMFV